MMIDFQNQHMHNILLKTMGIIQFYRSSDSLLCLGNTWIYHVYKCAHLVSNHVEDYLGQLATWEASQIN